MTRTRAYVDGFNLYCGALKGTRYNPIAPITANTRMVNVYPARLAASPDRGSGNVILSGSRRR